MRTFMLACWTILIMAVGCSGSDAEQLVISGPAFDPIRFFEGHTHSWGVIENRSAAPTQQIETDSHATLDATNRLIMQQRLLYQDGSSQDRNWTMWRNGAGNFEATANDMVGSATGEVTGRMFHWQWVMARSPGNPLMNVTMNQWMYQMPDGAVLIRTTVTKLGFILAEVTEQFSHPEPANGLALHEPVQGWGR